MHELQQAGYRLQSDGVWERADYTPLPYSDGRAVEERIADLLAGIGDLSVLSDELRPLCTDWPTRYHLGEGRANLLRPVEALFRRADVLEVGAGCGAITRYLGETGAQVLGLEGSPRRARIARRRTRDLSNVTVAVDRFSAFQSPRRFDVITLIGVLEYAGQFESGLDPWLAMLERALRLLRPGGHLLLAIENQLGLKYFLGAPEDHRGIVGYGIADQYRAGEARTFAWEGLSALLTRAGFGGREVLIPFPDYKMVRSVVSPAGLADSDFDVAALASQSVTHDPQFRNGGFAAPERVWPSVVANNLLPALANSFLVVAANGESLAPADALAWHYSTVRRRAYCKATRFVRADGTIRVETRLLSPESPGPDGPLHFAPVDQTAYVGGETLAARAGGILTSTHWRVSDLVAFFGEYRRHLTALIAESGHVCPEPGDVPGEWVDALPQNIVVAGTRATLIDREWTMGEPVPFAFLVFRSILALSDSVTRLGTPDDPRAANLLGLVELVFEGMGLDSGPDAIGRYLELESRIQRQVKGLSAPVVLADLAATELPVVSAADDRAAVPVEILNTALRGFARDSAVLRQAISSVSYAERNPDLGDTGADPFAHWLSQGYDEGRLPSTDLGRLVGEMLSEHEARSSERTATLEAMTGEIRRLEETLARQHETAAALRQRADDRDRDLAAVYASTSWRLTRGLRAISRFARRVAPPYVPGDGVFRVVRWVYRRIPLPRRVKHRGRAAWMQRLFKYQAGPAVPAPVPAVTALAPADGRREWVSYAPFKARLVAHAETVRGRLSPPAIDVLAIAEPDTRLAAGRIRFDTFRAPLVSVIVPVYGGGALAVECLASLAKARVHAAFEVIVADDASPDGTADVLALVEGIRLRRNASNVGFLRNCNQAFTDVRGAFTVVLNSDVQVTDGWLDALVNVFETHADAGAVGPRILYPSGHLQESGVAFRPDGTSDMIGLNDDPSRPCYAYVRPVDYCSGAALMVRTATLRDLGGFDEEFAPAYCEDADFCLRLRARGLKAYYTPHATVVHHLSRTMAAISPEWKRLQIAKNLATFTRRWAADIASISRVRVLAFYLPQFHAIPENDAWWGTGFTEWTNVRKARPNFEGHYQPREPADLGYYDLTDPTSMDRQAALARRYGIDGFVYYYYWFGGKRLLEMPLERLLTTNRPDHPYCLCWANENWSRRWDGRDEEILVGQAHSADDDRAVIRDIARHFGSALYIRIDGRPLVLVYRVELFPDFRETAARWREVCRGEGHGEIYLAYVESHDLVHKGIEPSAFGCDASVEFPPLNMAERTTPGGAILNPRYQGAVGDYAATAFQFCTRELPGYPRFRGVMPGWDNTPRRQDHGFAFEGATPGVFQAWLEHVIAQTRAHRHGDERLVFVNAWNEWAEGAYLEPDRVFGHAYLEAVRNAKDAEWLLRLDNYGLTV